MMNVTFEEFFEAALATPGVSPYPHQRWVAERGLPDLLRADTGTGKTEAAILGWLWRRQVHPDPDVRADTPHWLVFALPMRSLVEQTHSRVTGWISNLAAAGLLGRGVDVHLLLGGTESVDDDWRARPEHDAVLVGTVDMLLSRALNRGYGESRWSWPLSFGAFNSDAHWVFDEIQLLDSALVTSRQIQAFRDRFGTAGPTATTWMSATIDERTLDTVDNPWTGNESTIELTVADAPAASPLKTRLLAVRHVEELLVDVKDAKAMAQATLDAHQEQTLTIVVCNTVDRAVKLHAEIAKNTAGLDVHLIHSRFRPPDRSAAMRRILAAAQRAEAEGTIVIATQVLEAGVDLSATTLITEAAPWASIVQRNGRCNRDGTADGARLLWVDVGENLASPYDPHDVADAVRALRSLNGESTSPSDLSQATVGLDRPRPVWPTLRRSDLIDLFDTGPDLSGNDIDVSRFIRAPDDERDVTVFWRRVSTEGLHGQPRPSRDETCTIPIGEFRAFSKRLDAERAWVLDHLNRGDHHWVPALANRVRPGAMILVDCSAGGYTAESGWSRASKTEVAPLGGDADAWQHLTDADDHGVDTDPASRTRVPVELGAHLLHVEAETRALIENSRLPGLSRAHTDSAVAAARYHDVGKAHLAFQNAMHRTDDSDEREREMLAKSGHSERLRYRIGATDRPGFRHELVSLLALDGPYRTLVAGAEETDLICYLVAAHHGRIRMSIRSLPSDGDLVAGDGTTATLGVLHADAIRDFRIDDSTNLEGGPVDLHRTLSGDLRPESGSSELPGWSDRATFLRDRADLGPFRLGTLEMLVRLADWRASHKEQGGEYG